MAVKTASKKHATIHMMTVNIKTMQINNKQVTLSTFRQLKEESVVKENLSLRGALWGTVRYRWKDTPDWCSHYLVWQLGDELRRMSIPSVAKYREHENYRSVSEDMARSFGFGIYSWDPRKYLAECVEEVENLLWGFEKLDQLFIAV